MAATKLVRYDAMCRSIAQAYAVDEVKDIRDKAIALEIYSRLARNTEAERQACEIRLRAERKAGQLLKKRDKAQGRRNDLVDPSDEVAGPKTLEELGISRDQSSKWQQLGAVPDDLFEEVLQQAEKPTTNGILRATAAPEEPLGSNDALWLWGRLRDFERDGLLAKNPAEIVQTLPAVIQDEVHKLAPRVAAWLRRIGGLDVH